MDLQKEYDEIINWAKKNDVLLVKAELNSGKAPLISFEHCDEERINSFKRVVLKLNGRVIIYKSFLLTSEDYKDYLGYIKKTEDVDMIEDFTKLEPYQNRILNYSFGLVSDGAIYCLENEVEESEIYYNTQQYLLDVIEAANTNSLPEKKANELARQLANEENYSKAKNRTQKELLAQKLFPDLEEYDGDSWRYINVIAENIYEMEIKPIREKQLIDNVQKLKEEGKNKVTICSLLKISKDILNKYY